MRFIAWTLLNFVVGCLLFADQARAADVDPAAEKQARAGADGGTVAAKVNGRTLTVDDVELVASSIIQGRKVPAQQLAQVQADVLNQLIDRSLVEEVLKSEGSSITDQQLDKAMEQMMAQLRSKQPEVVESLKQRSSALAALRKQLAWQLVWDQYLTDRLNNAALEAYFKEHHRDYDGTELRASHILLRPAAAGDATEIRELTKRAQQLREQLVRGKITFENAASQYSGGPSRKTGGDIGFFPRRGLMEESFAKAAFALKKDEVSQPVTTTFGVHLIKVTEVRPGQREWSDSSDQLKVPAAMDRFEKMAAAARAKAKIEFTEAVPHFKPGTRQLATASDKPAKKSAATE
jgi:parvulin-like peptidyl-prolyl isomerase